jgi:hypothetical protein
MGNRGLPERCGVKSTIQIAKSRNNMFLSGEMGVVGFFRNQLLPIMNDNKRALRQNASKKGSIEPRLTAPHVDAISEQKMSKEATKRLILCKNAIFGGGRKPIR